MPVVTVGFGSENAGAGSKDIAVRDLVAGPTVFVKNQLLVRGVLVARGFANQPIDVEMFVEDDPKPVATQTVKVPEGTEVVPITGLKYIPQTPGEKKITLRVKPKEGELLQANNEISTFITVLAGGLNVLYLQGATPSWEYKFLFRSIMASPDIQGELKVIRRPAGETPEIERRRVRPRPLQRLHPRRSPRRLPHPHPAAPLDHRRREGGGADHARRPLQLRRRRLGEHRAGPHPARQHPSRRRPDRARGRLEVHPQRERARQLHLPGRPRPRESPRGSGTRCRPSPARTSSASPSPRRSVLAEGPGRMPIMVGMETGKGRVLAFGGETWVWARASDEGRLAHRKFWRQVIFWLAHSEDKGENQVKLTLDRRRIAVGQRLDLTATARDAKNVPIVGVEYETIDRAAKRRRRPSPSRSSSSLRATRPAGTGSPPASRASTRSTVVARSRGKEVGRDTARFLVYQDDRETENPAADLALLRQIAEATGGESLPPEQLPKYLQSLEGKMVTEYVSQTEHRVWDNWPFFLIFTTLLMLEWWLRKRHGWV